MDTPSNILAFSGENLVAEGSVASIAQKLKSVTDQSDKGTTLFFDGSNGRQIDIDVRGVETNAEPGLESSSEQDSATPDSETPKTRGRPKLGVVGREVTLLPRHWAWLDTQRGGASAALRRLVDQERKEGAEVEQIRASQDSANRFMYAMAGNLEGFEEAVRALYARDRKRFEQETRGWPTDIRACARRFADFALV